MPDLSMLLEAAIDAAHTAGKKTLPHFHKRDYTIEYKENRSPVTIADRTAEEEIERFVRARFPDHGILGEEFGDRSGNASIRWIVDPIDGTKSFVHGVPLYGTLVGIEVEGKIAVGVVYMPALDETYYAAQGTGAFCNGRRIRVSETADLAEAVILCTDERKLRDDPEKGPGYIELCGRTKFQRSWGDCYGHMLVASGRAEGMLDPKMALWDCAPLQVIVEEAGGIFTDWRGEPTIYGGSAITTNAALREEIATILSGQDHAKTSR